MEPLGTLKVGRESEGAEERQYPGFDISLLNPGRARTTLAAASTSEETNLKDPSYLPCYGGLVDESPEALSSEGS